MELVKAKLTVYFEEPYWVGLYERCHKGQLEVAKITFGAEPKDYEVLQFLLQSGHKLRFSPPVAAAESTEQRINPKRLQREVRRQLQTPAGSTKAQQALQLQREDQKLERKTVSRQQKELEQQRQYLLRQQKKKAKHRGH